MSSPQDFPDALRKDFEPLRPLGTGAFAHVFLARDRALGREVAVKILRAGGEGEAGKRFLREASTLASLKSPNLVEVYDFGVVGETPYLVMEYLEGESLAARRLDVDAARVMAEVGRCLLRVHEAGLVHRDLKPENVLLAKDGRIVLADFGLVSGRSGGTRITRAGARIGTVLYMAPEVLRGEKASAGADWYSWGVMLYLYLLGRTPHTIDQVMEGLQGRQLPAVDLSGLAEGSPEVGFLSRTLSRDPARRALTGAELDILEGIGQRASAPAPVVRAAPPGRAPDTTQALRPPSQSYSPWRPGILGALGLLLLVAVVSRWDLGSPGQLMAAPGAGAAGDARADLDRALEALLGPHRMPDGDLAEALRGGSYDEHLAEVVAEYRDPRYPIRWRRMLERFRTWSAAVQADELEATLRQKFVVAIQHLARDRGMITAFLMLAAVPRARLPGELGPITPDLVAALESRRREVAEVIEAALGEIPALHAPAGNEARMLRAYLVGSFVRKDLEHELARVREQVAHLPPSVESARFWLAGMVLLPNTLESSTLGCPLRMDYYLSAVRAFRAIVPSLTPSQRAEWASYAAYQWYTVMGECSPRPGDGGPDRATCDRILGQLLDTIDENLTANPASVASFLSWANAYDVSLGLLGGMHQRTPELDLRLSRSLSRSLALCAARKRGAS